MSGMKRLISVYLTVAVILTLVISGFRNKGIAVFLSPEAAPTESGITTQEAVTGSAEEAEPTTLPEAEATKEDNSEAEEG